jgi:hypothetical protein
MAIGALCITLIPRGRFPELDAIALRIDDPAEPTVFELFDTIVDLHALLPELSEIRLVPECDLTVGRAVGEFAATSLVISMVSGSIVPRQ